MLPENIDDLFRQKLDGHATPPAPDLWQRLALPAAEADPVDGVFRAGLGTHATPPRRELWERLEDEHLRPQPRKRRVAGWWQYSAAAVLLLLLLAGGGLLWRGSYQLISGGEVAHVGKGNIRSQTAQQGPKVAVQEDFTQLQPTAQPQDLATTTALADGATEKNKKNFSSQATAPRPATSSTPMTTTTQPRRAATADRAASSHHLQRQQPDADAGTLVHLGGRKSPTSQRLPIAPKAVTPAVPPTTHDSPVLAATTAPAEAPEIIEVEVLRGAARPAPAAVVAAADATPAPTRRRGLRLGGLLRQADHLVHGEPVSLAEATGLPESVTVQARLGGRLVSKTIQL